MRILVVSDTHSCFDKFYEICVLEKPDIVLFSGDGVKEALDMEILFPQIKFFIVNGNCDYYNYGIENELLIELEGTKFLLTHGHFYAVKKDYAEIEQKGFNENIDIFVFGHTHKPDYVSIERQDKNLVLFNPGAVLNNRYGIIEISKNKEIKFVHKKLT